MHNAEWKHAGENRFRANISNALWRILSGGFQPIFEVVYPIDLAMLAFEINMRAYDILKLFARIEEELRTHENVTRKRQNTAPRYVKGLHN